MSQENRVSSPSRTVRALGGVATVALVFGLGLLSGRWAGGSRATAAPEGEGSAHAGGGGPPAPVLNPRTLANLGVVVGEIQPTLFVRTREVPAVVEARPGSTRAVYAPVAGRLVELRTEPGAQAEGGSSIGRVLRDPFPRPTLGLTEAVLGPVLQDFPHAVSELRSAAQALAIAREELERIRTLVGSAPEGERPLAGKVEVDLVYEERRGVRALASAREEAARRGLSAEEIAAVERGGEGPARPYVRRVLQRHQLWTAEADALLALLPEAMRGRIYVLSVLGELAGANVLTPALVEALRARPALAAAFLDVAGLLQQGTTVDALVSLVEQGGLEAVVPVRVPDDAPAYDVASVHVRAGARVEAGSVVADLVDLAEVYLRLSPSGPEIAAVSEVVAAGETVSADPFIAGSGPRLEGLRVLRLESGESGATHGSAVAIAKNEVLCQVATSGELQCRSWRLRPGLRYLVRIPVEEHPDVFVLPSGAVTSRGADSVVLLEDGDAFRAVPVRVLHLDAKVAVVPNDGAVFPGDRVALQGAYALGLALQAGPGAGSADPHAGHNH